MPRIKTPDLSVTDVEIVHRDLSYSIVGAAYEVHNTLGPGFLESLYQRAMEYELRARGLAIECQKAVNVSYKGHHIGTHRLDLVVDGKVLVELKAVVAFEQAHRQQVLSYLKAADLRLGILINFGTPSVQYERILN